MEVEFFFFFFFGHKQNVSQEKLGDHQNDQTSFTVSTQFHGNPAYTVVAEIFQSMLLKWLTNRDPSDSQLLYLFIMSNAVVSSLNKLIMLHTCYSLGQSQACTDSAKTSFLIISKQVRAFGGFTSIQLIMCECVKEKVSFSE